MDSDSIYEIIQDLPNESDLITLLKDSRIKKEDTLSASDSGKKSHPTCLVVEAYGQTIGLLLAEEVDAEPYVEQYDVESFMDVSRHRLTGVPTLLKSFILNPLFLPHSKSILGEAMSLLHTTTLFYPMQNSTRHDLAARQLVLKDFVPVQRRRRIQYPNDLNDGTPVHKSLPYGLRFFCVSLLHEPRLTYNVKIVIVGASDAGLGFAQRLVYTPHLHFTNVTLISADGLPTMEEGNYFSDSLCFDSTELKQIGLANYVNVIPGRVVGIHRESKQVIMSDNTAIP